MLALVIDWFVVLGVSLAIVGPPEPGDDTFGLVNLGVLVVMYVPFFQSIFGTAPLPLDDWLTMIPFILAAPIAAELTKLFVRWRVKQTNGRGWPVSG